MINLGLAIALAERFEFENENDTPIITYDNEDIEENDGE